MNNKARAYFNYLLKRRAIVYKFRDIRDELTLDLQAHKITRKQFDEFYKIGEEQFTKELTQVESLYKITKDTIY